MYLYCKSGGIDGWLCLRREGGSKREDSSVLGDSPCIDSRSINMFACGSEWEAYSKILIYSKTHLGNSRGKRCGQHLIAVLLSKAEVLHTVSHSEPARHVIIMFYPRMMRRS